MVDISQSTREAFVSQILDSLYSSDKWCHGGLRLIEIDGIVTEVIAKSGLHFRIWEYCARELELCLQFGKITEQERTLMLCLDTLEVFNNVYNSINRGRTAYLGLVDVVESLAKNWDKRVSLERLMRTAMLQPELEQNFGYFG